MQRNSIAHRRNGTSPAVRRKFYPVPVFRQPAPKPQARLVTVPSFVDDQGVISVMDWAQCLPFEARRFSYIHEPPRGPRHGGHSHFTDEEAILAVSGSLIVTTDDGLMRKDYLLDSPDLALYIPPMLWHEVHSFSAGALCACFTSEPYDEEDYLYDYDRFVEDTRILEQ